MGDGHNDSFGKKSVDACLGWTTGNNETLRCAIADESILINNVFHVEAAELKEGTKHDGGKPTIALIPSKPLLEVAKVLDYGKNKYGSHNWRKGIDYTRVLSAAQRHIMAWNDGQNVDVETNLSHLAHAACNLLFLLEYELSGMSEFDDRYKKDKK